MYKVKIQRIHPDAAIPRYSHEGDAGLDLCSVEEKLLKPGERCLVRTGIRIELPKETEAQIRPRSGLALANGITVLNSPGTIDEPYRGEIGVILINHGSEEFHVKPLSRIAQMVIKPVCKAVFEEVAELAASPREGKGFGSSGVHAQAAVAAVTAADADEHTHAQADADAAANADAGADADAATHEHEHMNAHGHADVDGLGDGGGA